MDLKNFKDELNKANFSDEIVKAMNNILDKAIERGGISEEEKIDLAELLNIESETMNIESDFIKESIVELNKYDDELLKIADEAEKDIKVVDKKLADDINNIVNQAQISQARDKIKEI